VSPARCIVHGIREDKLPIAKFLDPSVPDFDPAHPDAFADFHLPYTPPQKQEDVTQIPQANLKWREIGSGAPCQTVLCLTWG
jgi:hypothetical protein